MKPCYPELFFRDVRALLFALTALATLSASAAPATLSVEFWAQPRSAQRVLAEPTLRQVAQQYLAEPDSRVVVHYASGEENQLRAEELRGWFAALGLDAARIALSGDLPGRQDIQIETISNPARGSR